MFLLLKSITEKISKRLNKYTTALDFVEKALVLLSGAGSGVSLFSCTTAIGTLVGVASASVSLVFLISNGIVKMFLKTMGRNKNKHRKIALLVRSKLNRIEKIIYKTLVVSDIIHDVFTLMINKEQNYFRLKEKHQSNIRSAG